MADQDYYPEPSTDETSQSDSPSPKGKPDADYETFLVPKAAFGEKGIEPGQTETIECVHVYEDEVECRCSGGEKKNDKSTMDEAMDEMGSMAKEE